MDHIGPFQDTQNMFTLDPIPQYRGRGKFGFFLNPSPSKIHPRLPVCSLPSLLFVGTPSSTWCSIHRWPFQALFIYILISILGRIFSPSLPNIYNPGKLVCSKIKSGSVTDRLSGSVLSCPQTVPGQLKTSPPLNLDSNSWQLVFHSFSLSSRLCSVDPFLR